MKRYVAILDTMWGASGRAPLFFQINPRNHSGRRLYWLTNSNHRTLLVVNACPQQTGHANRHGTPSTIWLARSLAALPKPFRRATLLVCGKVAQRTYDESGVEWLGPIVRIDHPAARRWTREALDETRERIARL